MLTRALGCLGLANLLLLGEWQNLYAVYDHGASYFAGDRYPLTYAWSTALTVVLIGVGLTLASTLLARLRQSCRASAIDRMVLAVNALVLVEVWISGSTMLASPRTRAEVAVAMLIVAVAFVVRLPNASALSSGARLLAWTALLFPLFLVTTLVRSATYPRPTPAQTLRTGNAEPATNRLVWVVLDEFDPTVAFTRRPPGLHLDALDALRSESIVATSAYAPGSWTLDALPTLWTGRPVGDAQETGPSDLRLTHVGTEGSRQLSESDTVFARAHAAGLKVGIAGWYHPYCRLFGPLAEQCDSVSSSDAFWAFRRAAFAADRGTLGMVSLLASWHALWSREAILTGGFVQSRAEAEEALMLSQRADAYRQIHAQTLAMVRDPSLALVFAHYPVPHLPGFYDAVRGEIDVTMPHGYMDNLALADRSVSDLLRAAEEVGLGARTSFLVHSDHGLRPDIWKRLHQWTPELEALTNGRQSALTPFILKLAGQDRGVEYDQPFNTALVGDLVLAILDGRLQSPAEATTWLEANRTRLPLKWSVRTLLDR